MRIETITSKKIWLAPLAGITDQPFRILCKEFGADVVVSEMISATGVTRGSKKTLEYANFSQKERPFGIQLFGSNPLDFARAIEILLPKNPDFFDINMGCPVKKVVKRGAGSALLKNSVLANEIISACKKSLLGTDILLTAKIRSGWDKVDFLDFVKNLQQADAITLHPRTRAQGFSGKSNWSLIKKLKENLSIPVIGNGDVKSKKDIKKIYSETGCDSVMIGRGAVGNPFIFQKKGGEKKLLKVIKKHFKLQIRFYNEKSAVQKMKKHICAYIKGLPNSTIVRDKIVRMETKNQMLDLLSDYLNSS